MRAGQKRRQVILYYSCFGTLAVWSFHQSMKYKWIILFVLYANCPVRAQIVYPAVPKNTDPAKTYILYLHGKIVEDQGMHAVSEKYGPYRYAEILQALARRDMVISEVRTRDADPLQYAHKVVRQIDTLMTAGVPYKILR